MPRRWRSVPHSRFGLRFRLFWCRQVGLELAPGAGYNSFAVSVFPADQRRGSRTRPSKLLAAESDGHAAGDPAENVAWYQATVSWTLAGGLLLWLALPPLQIAPLAWLAPVFWIQLIRRKTLAGRRPYRAITLAGFAFWIAAIHWMALPHWTAGIGMVVLSVYLAFYFPVFIGLSRVAVHRLRIPVMVAAPVVFTGLELARAHLFSGFLMAALSHTQYQWIELIQISDLSGAYGVTFLMVLVAASLARMLPSGDRGFAVWPLVPAVVAMGVCLGYGFYRMTGDHVRGGDKPVIALIQGTIDTEFGVDQNEVKQRTYRQYLRLSRKAADENPHLDLIVWPESMYPTPWIDYEDGAEIPPWFKDTPDQWKEYLAIKKRVTRDSMRAMAEDLGSPLLLGVDAHHFNRRGMSHYGSSIHVGYVKASHTASIKGRYDKMHLVMFGEYVPLGDWFPFLYELTPLPGGLTPGKEAQSFAIGDRGQFLVAPNICFESVVPHLVRSQVADLQSKGRKPDVLITQANDGWFWGSSALDMHLVCSVFRAIECRTPYLTAANTGFSAYVDANGRMVQRGPRREEDVIIARVDLDTRDSLYVRYGDSLAGICLSCCLGLALVGLLGRRR